VFNSEPSSPKSLPVLRGFSRNVKQDSEANEVSGGVTAEPHVAHKTEKYSHFAPSQLQRPRRSARRDLYTLE
jgi:hypothetical protein